MERNSLLTSCSTIARKKRGLDTRYARTCVQGVMHSGGNSVHWYGARTVYHFGVSSEGVNVFEERVVCILAKDTEDAHSKAVKESEKYAESNDFEMYPEQVCYRQDGGKLINEYEVWSELFQSTQSLDEFYKERYLKYLYDPEKA